jgi:hypothetical protein
VTDTERRHVAIIIALVTIGVLGLLVLGKADGLIPGRVSIETRTVQGDVLYCITEARRAFPELRKREVQEELRQRCEKWARSLKTARARKEGRRRF